jgi:hypothetical protein
MRNGQRILRTVMLATLLGGALIGVAQSAPAGSEAPPKFTFDGAWPKLPLPNKWTFEGITGLVVDKDDVIWVLQRPSDFDIDPIFRIPERTENYASLNPPTASCCVKPEAVLAFDQQGNLLKHWNQADHVAGHLILSDSAGNIWIGSDTMRKYDRDGKAPRDDAARFVARSEGRRLPRRHSADRRPHRRRLFR